MEYVEPSAAERTAVRNYCVSQAAIAAEGTAIAKRKRALAAEKKEARDAMLEQLVANGVACYVVPDAPGGAVYVRLKTYSNQAAISAELLADALDELDDELPSGDALSVELLAAIKAKRVVSKRYADVSTTAPQGAAFVDADDAMRALCARYAAASKELAALEKALKAKVAPLKENAKREGAIVTSFMARASIASQRVNVAGADGCSQTYFIRRKQSQKRPRITNQLLEQVVRASIASIPIDDPHFKRLFREKVATLIDQLPCETVETLKLDRGALKRGLEQGGAV